VSNIGKLQAITELLGGKPILDDNGNPTGELSPQTITPEQARVLLGFPEPEQESEEQERESRAEKYATGNHSVSFADTADACAFAEGWNAALRHSPMVALLVNALKMNLMKDTINDEHDWQTCNQPSCVIGRKALAAYESEVSRF
jgi:hypothetical protein